MHKGNRYPIEQRMRVFMRGSSPSFWIAQEYKVEGINWIIHTGAPAPAVDQFGIVLQSIDATAYSAVYYTSFLWNTHNVDFGFEIRLNSDHTRSLVAGYLTVSGVDQNNPIAFQPTNEDWQGIGYDTIQWSAAPGATLFPDFDFFEAVGY